MTETALDRAHRAAEQGDTDARLQLYEQLAETDLVILLEAEPEDDQISPVLKEIDGVRYIWAFDAEERLAAFAGDVAAYAGLPGRALVEMIAGQEIGVGLNFDTDATGFLVPPDAVAWLHTVLSNRPDQNTARPIAFAPPVAVTPDVPARLETRLRSAAGLAQAAYLTEARYSDGQSGLLLVFVGASAMAEASLAQAVSEAMAFSGVEDLALDVAFLAADAGAVPALMRQSIAIPIPGLKAPPSPAAPKPPGSDGPPNLR